MPEMIARVARALMMSDGDTEVSEADYYRGQARAAITAMREPTEGVLRRIGFAEDEWRIFIDAALKEGEP